MARTRKPEHTAQERRQARHIEESYEARGVSPPRAARIAWATVNQQAGARRSRDHSRVTRARRRRRSARRPRSP